MFSGVCEGKGTQICESFSRGGSRLGRKMRKECLLLLASTTGGTALGVVILAEYLWNHRAGYIRWNWLD